MTTLERIKRRLPEADSALLEGLLEEAAGMILALTGRESLPAALETVQLQLAVILYNREGIEGQTAHAEGGVSRTIDALPEEIRRQIAPYRLAKVVNVHAASQA